ncbi:MAG: hypothetical protein ACOX9R_04385 [Armatimonadota bacterium]|jgi:hypothetical protein
MTGYYLVFESIGRAVLKSFEIPRPALRYVARQGLVRLLGCTRVSDAAIDFYRDVQKPGVSPQSAPSIYTRLAEERHPPLGIVFDWRQLQ